MNRGVVRPKRRIARSEKPLASVASKRTPFARKSEAINVGSGDARCFIGEKNGLVGEDEPEDEGFCCLARNIARRAMRECSLPCWRREFSRVRGA